MAIRLVDIRKQSGGLPLRVAKGHFATGHSHINYYIDLTMTKHRLSEAQRAAQALCAAYSPSTIVDTILCLDGTEVIGACMAAEFTRAGFANMNAHHTVYVMTPEQMPASQLVFRDNIAPMIAGKHVLVLAAAVTTGYTAQIAVEAVRCYMGVPVGVCCIFSALEECEEFPVVSVYSKRLHLEDYESHPSQNCPFCKSGVRVDAMVGSQGISSF